MLFLLKKIFTVLITDYSEPPNLCRGEILTAFMWVWSFEGLEVLLVMYRKETLEKGYTSCSLPASCGADWSGW